MLPALCFITINIGQHLDWHAVRANIYYMDKQNEQNELERIKEESGLSWRKFAESFRIPYRTVQDWHLGNRPMPEYILRLMVYKVETERLLKEYRMDKGSDSHEDKAELLPQ